MKKLINNETEIAAKVHNTLDNVSLNKNYSEATSPNVSQVTTKEIYPGIFMAPINLPRNLCDLLIITLLKDSRGSHG